MTSRDENECQRRHMHRHELLRRRRLFRCIAAASSAGISNAGLKCITAPPFPFPRSAFSATTYAGTSLTLTRLAVLGAEDARSLGSTMPFALPLEDRANNCFFEFSPDIKALMDRIFVRDILQDFL